MQQGSLFGDAFDRQALAERVRDLSCQNIFLGTSSWRYEGWLGQLYTPERYYSRGRFSKKKFHEECIAEYAETFPVVGGDFSFYAIPEPAFWKKLFEESPNQLKWSLKVPEEFTVKRFSNQPRYGDRRGLPNPAFLNLDLFQAGWLEPLSPFFDRIAVLIFEFGTFSKANYAEPAVFLKIWMLFFADCHDPFAIASRFATTIICRPPISMCSARTAWLTPSVHGAGCRACASNCASTTYSQRSILSPELCSGLAAAMSNQ